MSGSTYRSMGPPNVVSTVTHRYPSDHQPATALGAAPRQYLAPIGCRHSGAKSVRTLAAYLGRVICPFHTAILARNKSRVLDPRAAPVSTNRIVAFLWISMGRLVRMILSLGGAGYTLPQPNLPVAVEHPYITPSGTGKPQWTIPISHALLNRRHTHDGSLLADLPRVFPQ